MNSPAPAEETLHNYNKKRKPPHQDSPSKQLGDDLIFLPPKTKKKHKSTPINNDYNFLTSPQPLALSAPQFNQTTPQSLALNDPFLSTSSNSSSDPTAQLITQPSPQLLFNPSSTDQPPLIIHPLHVESVEELNNPNSIDHDEPIQQISNNSNINKELANNPQITNHLDKNENIVQKSILGLQPSCGSDDEAEDENIFCSYIKIGQGYMTFNLPTLEKSLRKREEKQIERFNRRKLNQLSIPEKSATAAATTSAKSFKQRLSLNANLNYSSQSTTKGQNLLKATKASLSLKQQHINSQTSQRLKHHQSLDYLSKQHHSLRTSKSDAKKLLDSSLQRKRRAEGYEEKKHIENTNSIHHGNPRNSRRGSSNSNIFNNNSEVEAESMIIEEKKKGSSYTRKNSYPTASKKMITNNSEDTLLSSQYSDQEMDEESLMSSSSVRITLSATMQSELLKYHKKSKNYHGTAKQFGISHEEARHIIRIRKSEYKSIPN